MSAEQNNIARLYSIFENANAKISNRDSKNGKYSGFTIKVKVNDADDIILYYRQVAAIDGVVML